MSEEGEKKIGLGGGGGGGSGFADWERSVYDLLALGYPRLALARAKGIPFVPYYVNVRATFDNPDENLVPQMGSDVKIVSDTIIDQMVGRVTFDKTPQGDFANQNAYYFNFVSNIEIKIRVDGSPRPSIVPRFTPVSTVMDMFNGSSKFPHGIWVLTYQQQLEVDFKARIQLPQFPTTVVLTFRCFTPDDLDGWVGTQMTDREALIRLRDECNLCIPDCYITAGK